jgi:hypothetical protein
MPLYIDRSGVGFSGVTWPLFGLGTGANHPPRIMSHPFVSHTATLPVNRLSRYAMTYPGSLPVPGTVAASSL